MDDFWIWTFIGVISLISIAVTAVVVNSHKKDIRESLEKKGAKDISVSWMPLDFDKSNHTYAVEYTDADGKKHQRTCKLHTFWDDLIYWEDEP